MLMKRQFALLAALLLTCGVTAFTARAEAAPQAASQSVGTIQGTVVDANGQPVIGATISEIGTTKATSTDASGKFAIKAAPGARLQVSFIGYKTQTLKASNGMRVALEDDNALLDEVVVVGYGQQKKVNLTGAVSVVDIDKTLTARPGGDVAKALQGAVPGLTIINSTGDINGNPTMKIRGIVGSLVQESNPYVVVDGMPVDDLSLINPADIESISVLKDAAASAVYGARAAFGVVLITTKQAKTGDKIRVNYDNNFAWDRATYLPDYSTVPEQLRALIRANGRAGLENELFGMYLDTMLPYAEAWQKQNGGKAGYREMRPFQSWDDVGDYYVNADGSGAMYYADWDVKGINFRTAPSMTHNINVQGSSGRTNFYASFGYNSRESIDKFNPDKVKRYTAAANISTAVTDWLTAGIRFNYSNKFYSTPFMGRDGYTYGWRWGSYFGPYGKLRLSDGELYDAYNSILYRKGYGNAESRDYLMKISPYLKINITKDLTLHADYTFSTLHYNQDVSRHIIQGANTWGGNITNPGTLVAQSGTFVQNSNLRRNSWNLNVYLEYMKTFNEAHNLKVMIGGNGEGDNRKYFSVRRTSMMDGNYPEINLTDGTITLPNPAYHTHRATGGYFGRINYDYKGIYLVEVDGRYDGSSNFRKGDRWAFFPSFSLGYRFSQESYWDKIRHIVSNGKVRFSYGSIGNDQGVDTYFESTVSSIAAGSVHWLNGAGNTATKITEANMPTAVPGNLTWEKINTTDVGIDLGFLNDRITLGFDWFNRDTKDMIAPAATLPAVYGTTTPRTNAGTLRSRGWELTLGIRHSFSNDASIYFNGSISDAKVKVLTWHNDARLLNQYYSGAVYGDIWGFETERYFTEDDFNGPKLTDDGKSILGWNYKEGVADQTGLQNGGFIYGPGDIKFKDLNGDGVINAGDPNMKDADGNPIGVGTPENHGDLKVIGNNTPRYEYAFHIGGTWKGFDLDLYFQGVGKRDVWTTGAFVMPLMRGADATYANQESYNIYDYFNPGDNRIDQGADFPVLYPGNNGQGTISSSIIQAGNHNFYPQTKYLVDMSYLRLKNVTLGYTLPQDLTRKAYIERLRIYFSANNLCLLHKGSGDIPVDPEMNYNTANGAWGRTNPITRSLSFGLQLTF